MEAQDDYRVDTAWPEKRMADVDKTLRALLEMPNHVFHGAHESWLAIKSSLDLKLETHKTQHLGHRLEKDLLDRFAKQCFRHLQPGARTHIELARLRWKTHRTTGTLFVARHYGLPTCAVDWTTNALVALFFACRRSPEKDGVIWCMPLRDFESHVAEQWPATYGKAGHIEDDFEKEFVGGCDSDILVPLHFPPWMPRAVAQNAFITVAGKLGVDHGRKIHELGVAECKRVIIPASLKQPIIEKLDLMGVNGYTLEIGDSTVEIIGMDVAHSLFSCKDATADEPGRQRYDDRGNAGS